MILDMDSTIALAPGGLEALPGLLSDLAKGVDDLLRGNDADRHDLVHKCRSLMLGLQTPREVMLDHCWAQNGAIAAITFGIDSGLWKLMARNGDVPQKVAELAPALGIDPKLLNRLMRHLSSLAYLTQVGADEYLPTNYSRALSLPFMGHGYLGILASTHLAATEFYQFSRRRGWKNPTDASDTSLMHAYKTDQDLFEFLQSTGHARHFDDFMMGYQLGSPSWMDPALFPVQERLIDGADPRPESAFLVDIGGNVGRYLAEFRRRFPHAPGKLILQDLARVLDHAGDLDESIVRMEHNFHHEQPVKGARAYYMHWILHDWPDAVCESILARTKEAMKPGYSRLLIDEAVVPATGAHWETTGLDMTMLTLLSSAERTRAEWHELLEVKAGLRIVKIWTRRGRDESVIECERPC
ncbi:hypothetical protein CDD83_2868 [Cordyceps sp. RAO-2017]|nr:hypothetical protein CDD83_2868 [Cordyceps sp. RAO-2017]